MSGLKKANSTKAEQPEGFCGGYRFKILNNKPLNEKYIVLHKNGGAFGWVVQTLSNIKIKK